MRQAHSLPLTQPNVLHALLESHLQKEAQTALSAPLVIAWTLPLTNVQSVVKEHTLQLTPTPVLNAMQEVSLPQEAQAAITAPLVHLLKTILAHNAMPGHSLKPELLNALHAQLENSPHLVQPSVRLVLVEVLRLQEAQPVRLAQLVSL